LQGGVGLPSDIGGDVDWRVDDTDFDIVRANFGMSNPSHEDGDLTGDGHVDMADIDFLMAQYGLQLSVNI
jgi:hypothetical protein